MIGILDSSAEQIDWGESRGMVVWREQWRSRYRLTPFPCPWSGRGVASMLHGVSWMVHDFEAVDYYCLGTQCGK